MIFDLRIYTFKPGMQTAWLAMYEKHAYPIQLRYLGKPVVFTTTEVGPLNQVIHLWAYADQAERERKRNAMQQDPEWQTYIKMNTEAGYMEHMENRILNRPRSRRCNRSRNGCADFSGCSSGQSSTGVIACPISDFASCRCRRARQKSSSGRSRRW
jgi:hypothetical protein